MLFRSGRTYHSDFDMEAKLDLILKELKDLKLRIEVLENKKKSSRDDNQDEERRTLINVGMTKIDIICTIKIDPLTFDSILDPKILVTGWQI